MTYLHFVTRHVRPASDFMTQSLYTYKDFCEIVASHFKHFFRHLKHTKPDFHLFVTPKSKAVFKHEYVKSITHKPHPHTPPYTPTLQL